MDTKERLVESFLEFRGNTVSPENVTLARDCVQSSRVNRYSIIKFDDYLAQNQDTPRYLIMMTAAYDLLLKYVINLLKVKRPQVWRSIKTNNTAFKARVACMRGAGEILKNAGYTEAKENAMCFPDSVEEPDKQRLAVIAAELLMAKLDVEDMSKATALSSLQQPQRQLSSEHSSSSLQQQAHPPASGYAQNGRPLQPEPQVYQQQSMRDYSYAQPQTSQAGQTGYTGSTSLAGNTVQPPYTGQTSYTRHTTQVSPTPYTAGQTSYTGHSTQAPYTGQTSQAGPTPYTGQTSQAGPTPYTGQTSQAGPTPYAGHTLKPGPTPTSYSSTGFTGTSQFGQWESSHNSIVHNDSALSISSDPVNGTPMNDNGFHGNLPPGPQPIPKPRNKKPPTPPVTPLDQPSQYEDQAPTSMGSHRSSNSEEIVSLSSSTSDDSSSGSVVNKAWGFLEEYRAKKKRDDVAVKRKTADLTNNTPSSPHTVHKASTTIHVQPAVDKAALLRTASAPPGSADLSRRGADSPKIPPKKKQPSFHDDPILEQPEQPPCPTPRPRKPRERATPTSEGPSLVKEPSESVAIRFCPKCKNKLGEADRFCSYCGVPAASTGQAPQIPQEGDAPPLRASHQDAMKAEQHHRQTQVIDPSQSNDQPPPPQVPPRARPQQVPPPRPAWNDPTLPPPPRPPKTHPSPQVPATNDPPLAQGGSSQVPEGPGVKTISDKEKAWKEHQRKQGVKEKDLKPLEPAQKKSNRVPRKTVDPSQFPRKDISKPSAEFMSYDPGDVSRVEQLNREGRGLLDSIKQCVPCGYSLDEIQLAYSCDGRSLDYLQNEWQEMTKHAQRNLSLYKSNGQFPVGTPSQPEMRAALAKAGGNMKTAETAVFQEREKKVKQLLEKVKCMRAIDSTVPELSWEGAVKVLSSNDMEVDTAFYVLQCDWLKPLHDYIFDENNKNVLVNQKEMEEIKKVITNKDVSIESHKRLLMAECKFPTEEAANIVLQLLEEVEADGAEYPLQYYIEAAKDHGIKARDFLIKECSICSEVFPVHEFVALPGCIHSVCKQCFKGHFTVMLKEREVKHFTCPICGEPDMASKDIIEGFYLQLFMQLVKQHLDDDSFKLCDDKLKEFSLLSDPNFVWCANTECRSGFIHEGRAKDVTCPNCRKSMCRNCKRKWEPAHEGISCEAYTKWKLDNDPESQELGLAAHLQANGIECPQCHFKYDLARGGCMHFKCVKCPNEFCSGCSQSFKQAQDCGKLESCKAKGLHAHHPRDCLFYLRDFDVEELQKFLQGHNIAYDTAPKEAAVAAKDKPAEDKPAEDKPAEDKPADQVPADSDPPPPPVAEGADADKAPGCRAMLQKETPGGLKDEECGKEVLDNHAGLCMTHYKEYLVDLINKNKLDPITMYTTMKIELMLTREEMDLPDKDDDDDDQVQRDKLIQHVKKYLPLPNVVDAPPQAIAVEQAVVAVVN